jgi:hypothetical protein
MMVTKNKAGQKSGKVKVGQLKVNKETVKGLTKQEEKKWEEPPWRETRWRPVISSVLTTKPPNHLSVMIAFVGRVQAAVLNSNLSATTGNLFH